MAKKAKRRRTKRIAWTRASVAELRRYSKDKLRVKKISRLMKCSTVSPIVFKLLQASLC